jgi:hypothetical protein
MPRAGGAVGDSECVILRPAGGVQGGGAGARGSTSATTGEDPQLPYY